MRQRERKGESQGERKDGGQRERKGKKDQRGRKDEKMWKVSEKERKKG